MSSLYELALTVPWCCTPEALEALLSIAARDPLPTDEIAKRMHGPKALALRERQQRPDAERLVTQGSVALLPIDGPIYRYADFFTAVSGGVTTEALARDLQTALADPLISAVLFVIDSPGGEATGINELADTIYQARGVKPLAAYIEGYGASAAYWIASAADVVVVDATALIGSIGTVMGVPDPAKRYSRTIDFVSSQSPKKRADPTTDAGRAYLQQLVDDMTSVFVEKVARNRAINPEDVLATEGGLLIGQQAVDAGLADRLGSEETTIAALASGQWRMNRKQQTRPYLTAKEYPPMADQKGFWASFWGGAKEAGIIPEPSAEPVPAQAVAPDPRLADENAALRKQLAELQQGQIERDAAAFADTLIAAHKALPANRADLVSAYTYAATDDARQPLASGSRVATLKALEESRVAHRLTEELVPQGPLAALVSGAGGDDAAMIAQAKETAKAYAEQANKRNGNGTH